VAGICNPSTSCALAYSHANLTLSAKKCQFAAAELDYLGHRVGLGRVQPRMKKVEALLAYSVPVNRKQSFLELAGCYRKCVPIKLRSTHRSLQPELQQYNLNIVHLAGKNNLTPDLLSRTH